MTKNKQQAVRKSVKKPTEPKKPPAPAASSANPNLVAGKAKQPAARQATRPAKKKEQSLGNVARQLRTWSGTALGMVGPMADMSIKLATRTVKASAKPSTIRKAGAMLKQAREAAGMTVNEVAQAVNLRDAALLKQAEGGTAALPFEVILRLASVFGRHDPIPFVMKVTRSYNPELWEAMDRLGVGKLAVHAGREREFLNIYRANDEARNFSDEEFATVLGFVNAAFEMAIAFRQSTRKKTRSRGVDD